jgi:hypothetical protein
MSRESHIKDEGSVETSPSPSDDQKLVEKSPPLGDKSTDARTRSDTPRRNGDGNPPPLNKPSENPSLEKKQPAQQQFTGPQIYQRLLRSAVVILAPDGGLGSGALIHRKRRLFPEKRITFRAL